MARIIIDFSNTTSFAIVPDGEYKTIPGKIEERVSKMTQEGTGGNPMLVVQWKAVDGEFNGRIVGIENLMLGGSTKSGEPMPLFAIYRVIDALKVPWACLICQTDAENATLETRPFTQRKIDGNIQYFCPEGGHKLGNVTTDWQMWENRQCYTQVGHEMIPNTDRERNRIIGHRPVN